jgi:hypothetical protein
VVGLLACLVASHHVGGQDAMARAGARSTAHVMPGEMSHRGGPDDSDAPGAEHCSLLDALLCAPTGAGPGAVLALLFLVVAVVAVGRSGTLRGPPAAVQHRTVSGWRVPTRSTAAAFGPLLCVWRT